MRHLVFLQSMEQLPADSPEWAAVGRGYAVLQLTERWSVGENPDAILEGLASALGALGEFGALPFDRSPLGSLVRILTSERASRGGNRRVAAALFRYSIDLAYRGDRPLAHDVATTCLRFCEPSLVGVRWRVFRIRGQFNRTAGKHDAAESDYRRCMSLGRRFGILEAFVRGSAGLINVVTMRGNLPEAERRARRLLALCEMANRPDLASVAHHDLGCILGLMSRHDECMTHLHHALAAASGRDCDRIASDIGLTLVEQGHAKAARRLYETLLAVGSEPLAILIANVNLVQVYAALGAREELERQCQVVKKNGLPPREEVYFHLTLGDAYATLGEPERAKPEYQRAIELATTRGFGKAVIEADVALKRIDLARPVPMMRAVADTNAADEVMRTVERVYAQRTLRPVLLDDRD